MWGVLINRLEISLLVYPPPPPPPRAICCGAYVMWMCIPFFPLLSSLSSCVYVHALCIAQDNTGGLGFYDITQTASDFCMYMCVSIGSDESCSIMVGVYSIAGRGGGLQMCYRLFRNINLVYSVLYCFNIFMTIFMSCILL